MKLVIKNQIGYEPFKWSEDYKLITGNLNFIITKSIWCNYINIYRR
jgi:hypothetical protein